MRCAQENYTSRSGEDLGKMGVGILDSIRMVECLQGNLSSWVFEKEKWAYVFHYQSAERVCDKYDGTIVLHAFELSTNFSRIASDSQHPFSSLATILESN